MTRRRKRHRINPAWSKLERLTGVKPPAVPASLDVARREYMNTPEWWHHVWADDKERA